MSNNTYSGTHGIEETLNISRVRELCSVTSDGRKRKSLEA